MRRERVIQVAALTGLGLLAVAATVPAGAEPRGEPAKNGRLVCEGPRGGSDSEVYTINPDGSEVRVLTNNSVRDGDPAWSPNANKIAFESFLDGSSEVWKMNADGTELTQLTDDGPPEDRGVDWSPDGKQLVFHSARGDRTDPVLGGDFDIYKMNADGSGLTQLTDNPANDALPSWSPDGERIVFNSTRDDPLTDIYVMNADGTGVKRLTTFPGQDAGPVWSPDGEQIAFHSQRGGDRSLDIYRMNADGTGVTPLTQDLPLIEGHFDAFPAWSPDGTKIAWTSNRPDGGNTEGDYEVYTMNATDGSDRTRVTSAPGLDWRCDWGSRIGR